MKKFRGYFILILAATFRTRCSGSNKMKKDSNLVKYEVTQKVLKPNAGLLLLQLKAPTLLSTSIRKQLLQLLLFSHIPVAKLLLIKFRFFREKVFRLIIR